MTLAIGIDGGVAHAGFAAIDGNGKLLLVSTFESERDADRTGDTQARLGAFMDWAQEQCDLARGLVRPGGAELYCETDVFAAEWPVVGGRRAGAKSCPACGSSRGASVAGTAQAFAAAGALLGMLREQCGTLLAPVPITWRCAVAGGRVPTEDLHALIEQDFEIVAKVGRSNRSHGLDATGLALYAHQHLIANQRALDGASLH